MASDKWREAVDQELVVCGMTTDNFKTPQAAVRGLIDWHCAVQIDPAVSSSAKALIEPLIHIANIAHSGGLVGMTESEALTAIRRLSMAYWDTAGGSAAQGIVLLDAAHVMADTPTEGVEHGERAKPEAQHRPILGAADWAAQQKQEPRNG